MDQVIFMLPSSFRSLAGPLTITAIYGANRAVEETNFTRTMSNKKLLFHASHVRNFVGILSRYSPFHTLTSHLIPSSLALEVLPFSHHHITSHPFLSCSPSSPFPPSSSFSPSSSFLRSSPFPPSIPLFQGPVTTKDSGG